MNNVELQALTELVATDREHLSLGLPELADPIHYHLLKDELEQRGIVGTGKITPEPAKPNVLVKEARQQMLQPYEPQPKPEPAYPTLNELDAAKNAPPVIPRDLYEVKNSRLGCSYVRVYVWCKENEDPVPLARDMFGPGDRKRLDTRLLLTSRTETFCTKASDEGWEV